ncbi:hypothetical protein SLA2020_079040 [Shorea laevis]
MLVGTFRACGLEYRWTLQQDKSFGKGGIDLGGIECEMRSVRVKEVEKAKREGQKKFGILDVSKATIMTPNGHPGEFLGNNWHGYNDCLHWCLPGPIDVWNDFLMPVLRKEAPLV